MARLSEEALKVSGWSSKFQSVEKVLRHYSRKTQSEHTKRNVLDALFSFLQFVKEENPDRYVRLSRKKVEGDLQDFLDSMKSKGLSIKYVNTCHAYLATFFEQNGFRKEKELEIEWYHLPARYRKRAECIPTVQEAWEMVENAGSPKMKAAIACLYTSGLRNSTLRALLYRDVKEELDEGMEAIRLPVYHEMKRVDPDACKNDIPYYSFISKDASRILRMYVSEVRRKLGDIGDEMPLFMGEKANGRITHMKARTLQVAVHEAARKAGVKDWKNVYPHCLRKSFQSVLKTEYSDGGRMDPKDQEFLMGHILPGSQDTYYDKTKIDSLRSEYSRLAFDRQVRVDVEKMKVDFRRQLLLVAGFSDQDISKVDLGATSDEDFQKIIRERLLGAMENNGSRQKVVPAAQVRDLIHKGWEYVDQLPTGEAIVRLPF